MLYDYIISFHFDSHIPGGLCVMVGMLAVMVVKSDVLAKIGDVVVVHLSPKESLGSQTKTDTIF